MYKYLIFVQILDINTDAIRFWSKSKFSGQAIYDTIINNISETFNSVRRRATTNF